MAEHNVCKLAIPRIGCGLDRLEWDKVRAMIECIFNGKPVEIVVYNLNEVCISRHFNNWKKSLKFVIILGKILN